MLIAACIRRVAENLTRFVDVDCVRQGEASPEGNQSIEIDQATGSGDEGSIAISPKPTFG